MNRAIIGSNISATAKGTIRWIVYTDDGQPIPIEIDTLNVPTLQIWLLSPQQLGKQNLTLAQPTFIMRGNTSTLAWQGHSKAIAHNAHFNLPILFTNNERITVY